MEQNKFAEVTARSYGDNVFIHGTAKEPFPLSESKDNYRPPSELEERSRAFSSTNTLSSATMNSTGASYTLTQTRGKRGKTMRMQSEEERDHYISRWTKGTLPQSQTQYIHRDFRGS